jgi:hypothetical protein
LALVLTLVGVLLVYAGRMLDAASGRLRILNASLTRNALQALPIFGALGIVFAGLLITNNALALV